MAHDVSASALRSDHMSPPALALAVLLHVLAALALWWMSLDHGSRPPPPEDAIEVTVERPKPPPPPEPPKEPPKEPTPPATPMPQGLRPEAPLTADRRSQVPPRSMTPEQAREAFAPRQPAEQAAPQPQQQPPPSPPPPPTALQFPKPTLPPPVHTLPQPQPPPAPRPQLRPVPPAAPPPSPLAARTRPPPVPPNAEEPSRSTFVNPADVRNRALVSDNYLWQVVRKLSGYRYHATAPGGEILTVVRVTIARDGRLLAIDIARSSGIPSIDAGVLAGVRAGSPYAPLPPEIKGASATFTLPLVSVQRQ